MPTLPIRKASPSVSAFNAKLQSFRYEIRYGGRCIQRSITTPPISVKEIVSLTGYCVKDATTHCGRNSNCLIGLPHPVDDAPNTRSSSYFRERSYTDHTSVE